MPSHAPRDRGLYDTVAPVPALPLGSPLGGIDEAEDAGLLSNEKAAPRQRREGAWPLSPWLQVANVAMFLVSVCWLCVVAYQRFRVSNPLARQLSVYSPLFDRFELKVQPVQTKFSFYAGKDSARTRHLPNPEDDELWAEWVNARVVPVTRAELVRLGADPETAVRIPHGIWGRGDDVYAAALDVHHHLHCLDVLRRQVYFEHYGRPPARHNWTMDTATTQDVHAAHCIDVLAQVLQCVPNLDVHTFVWLAHHKMPFPRFDLRKQCVANFDELTQWRIDNGIDTHEFRRRIHKPEGQRELPAPDAFYTMHHRPNLNHVDGANPGEDFAL